MSFQPKFEQLNLKERVEPLKVQSVVECKANESYESFAKILSTVAKVTCLGAEALAGELRYSGRVIFNIVYVDNDGKLRKSECGAEFSHRAERPDILPSFAVDMNMEIDSTELKQVNGQLFLSAIVTANAEISVKNSFGYLSGGEDLVFKTEEINVSRSVGSSKGNFEVSEEFDINDAIGDILSYNAEAIVLSTQAGIGCIVSEGEIYLSVTAERASDGEIIGECKIYPFRMELEIEESMPNMKAVSCCNIAGAKFEVVVDTDRNKSAVSVEFNLEIKGEVFDSSAVEKVSDVYSTSNELNLTTQSLSGNNLAATCVFAEKVHGAAVMNEQFENDVRIMFCSNERVNVAATRCESGRMTAEGVMSATAYFKDMDGALGSVNLELPFSVELVNDNFTDGRRTDLSCIAENVFARSKAGREIELEGTLKFSVNVFDSQVHTIITDVAAGDEKTPKTCAISVYIPNAEDTLWEVSKELGVCPETIMAFNKDLQFPLQGDERIIIYRQEKIEE